MSELQDPVSGDWIPPEQLKDSGGQIIVPNAMGWNVTLTANGETQLLAFDYNTDSWYSIGTITNAFMDPGRIVAVSAGDDNHMPDPADVSDLLNEGLWFATETRRYAY